MQQLQDIYILLETYKKDDIDFFRETYLKGFEQASEYYEYPPYFGLENEFETKNVDDMISFMLQGNKGYFRFYFQNPNPVEVSHGMIFFNKDDTLVLGLRVLPETLELYEAKIQKDFGSKLIMICNEVPPPDNSVEFRRAIGKLC